MGMTKIHGLPVCCFPINFDIGPCVLSIKKSWKPSRSCFLLEKISWDGFLGGKQNYYYGNWGNTILFFRKFLLRRCREIERHFVDLFQIWFISFLFVSCLICFLSSLNLFFIWIIIFYVIFLYLIYFIFVVLYLSSFIFDGFYIYFFLFDWFYIWLILYLIGFIFGQFYIWLVLC